jgi:hypothetical protein
MSKVVEDGGGCGGAESGDAEIGHGEEGVEASAG